DVQAQVSETHTFYTVSDDGVRLWINGQLLIDNWSDHGPTENSGSIALTAGQKYALKMEYYENGGGATAKLLWSSASTPKQVIPQGQLHPPTAESINNAQFVSQSVPATMTAGQTYTVSVSMKNTGTNPWSEATLHRLGSENPRDNSTWGMGRVLLASGETIAPGATKTFTWTVSAPSTPGL